MFRAFTQHARSVVPVLLAALAACGGGNVVSADQLLAVLQGSGPRPLVLDVRTQREFDGGHVPGAVNIPHTQLQLRLGELESARNQEIVVYCEVGTRSQFAMSLLRQAGFADVRHLAGDMAGWRRQGLPVAR